MVLEGSVRKSNNTIRVTAQLINVADGFHLWSETYDRELADIFAVQDEIANQIVNKLKLEVHQLGNSPVETPNMEAYDLLLKGMYFLNKDFDGARKAMDYFQQAVEIDPSYATAYALIGDTYTNYAFYGFLPNAEAHTHAKAAALQAISLNEKDPLAHKDLAFVELMYGWNWEVALEKYQKAKDYGLKSPDQFMPLYEVFVNGNFDRAFRLGKEIIALDPLKIESHWHLGISYLFADSLDTAMVYFDEALELDPGYSEGHRWRGVTLTRMGRYAEALTSFEEALQISDGESPAQLDFFVAQILQGDTASVLPIIEGWEEANHPVEPMGPAFVYASLGQKDKAFQWLEQGYRERSFMLFALREHWIWDPYREDPRFQAIYERMGFPEG